VSRFLKSAFDICLNKRQIFVVTVADLAAAFVLFYCRVNGPIVLVTLICYITVFFLYFNHFWWRKKSKKSNAWGTYGDLPHVYEEKRESVGRCSDSTEEAAAGSLAPEGESFVDRWFGRYSSPRTSSANRDQSLFGRRGTSWHFLLVFHDSDALALGTPSGPSSAFPPVFIVVII